MQVSQTAFFHVERSLFQARMPGLSIEQKLIDLQQALQSTSLLETLYQRCQVLNELAAVLISTDQRQKALEYTNSALRLAQKQGYRLLRTRALLLGGIASEKHKGKEQKLLAAFRNASEMGLQELIAESAFHLGMLHLESNNLGASKEYLLRSVSITENLASEIPARFRLKYRAVHWRRNAREKLERCDQMIRQQSTHEIPDSIGAAGEDRYFKAVYNFALSGSATKSADGIVNHIEQTLQTSLTRGAVIVLKDLKAAIIRGVGIKVSDDLLERVRVAAAMAKNRIYFGAPDISRPRETVAWVPLQSEIREGGIYVVCRQNEPALTEKEMELLAIIGTIGNGALRTIEANQASALENGQLAEFHGMVGASKAIREVYSHIEIAGKNTATVLIEGDSGTGKELVARAIHAAGARAKEPFIAVDCGAIPEPLIEAELFGAKRGSYTGAITDRAGLFEAAHRGTIFLDEISNTTAALQGKLLRVIQEREIRRIGETKDRPIDVRVIVATNRNLEEMVTEGRFRKDLLYRLKVLYIKVPPLRSRREDIPMIAHAFLQKLNATNKVKKYCAPGVIDHLAAQNFPGNVRELQNAIERAFFLSKGNVIYDIPVEGRTATTSQDEVQLWFKELTDGRKNFWKTVHDGYKQRDITRDKLMALVDLGLRSSGGSYAGLASKFHLKRNEYRRFMDFLRRSRCLLDFRPYRQAAAREEDSEP
jgi:transcriptional regulator with GAF, ATPase, and Fis domain